MIRFGTTRAKIVVLVLERGRSAADVIERIATIVQAARGRGKRAGFIRLTPDRQRGQQTSRTSSPHRRYRQLSMRAEEFAFFGDFATRLSEREGFRLTTTQALMKAVIRYAAMRKITDEKGAPSTTRSGS